jgi:hypothetical protein
MKILALATAALVGATALQAQDARMKPEIRPFAGVNIPTGTQRELFLDAPMVGVAAALELQPFLHVVGSVGWAASQNHFAVADQNVDILMYDVGVELGFVEPLGGRWELKPFLGIGGGARTYWYPNLPDKTCASGYAAVGTEFQLAAWALRVEARDNLFCYRSPYAGVQSQTRNDVGLSLGLAYHFR